MSDQTVCEIKWIDCAEDLPDDETTVLIYMADGEIWTGFRDSGDWRYVSADLIDSEVTHWAEFPLPPEKNKKAAVPA